jgi:hypothetical protein
MLVLGPAVSFSCGENSLGLLHAKNRTLMGPFLVDLVSLRSLPCFPTQLRVALASAAHRK